MKNRFLGTWRLVSFELQVEVGDSIYPIGTSPIGIATIDEYGLVSVQLSSSDRKGFSSDPPGAGEIQAAFTSYIAYFGEYTIDEDKKTFTTKVMGGTNPSWIGEEQLRYFEISENCMVLKTSPQKVKALGDISVVGAVTWEKVT